MARKKSQTDVQPDQPAETIPTGEQPSDTNGQLPSNGHTESNSHAEPEKKKPAFKVGPIATGKGESVAGCVWENTVESNGVTYTVHSIVLEVNYYNVRQKQWLPSNGIRPSQLAAVEYVLRKCGDFAFNRRDPNAEVPF